MRKIRIFDTTLRDGEQSPGCSMTTKEKLEMARQLDALGVDIIEAGFAAASPDDFNAVQQIARTVKNCRVGSLARANRNDVEKAAAAVKDAKDPMIHVFIATSDIHMQYKLRMTPDEVVARIDEMVRLAKSYCENVEFSAEDASRSSLSFLARVVDTAIKAGATVINLPDTVGYATPQEITEMFTYIRKNVPGVDGITLSTHCHNDLGMATANSIAAIMAGCDQVEVAVNGIGERAGNASLEEVVMLMTTRKEHFGFECGINTKEIVKTAKLLSSIIGVPIAPNKPIIGANAFAHEAGIHQHGVMTNPLTYEIMLPESVGLVQNRMVLGKHSGKHAFDDRLKTLGYQLENGTLASAFEQFKALADKKKNISDDDLIALATAQRTKVDDGKYALEEFSITTGTHVTPTATVKMSHGGNTYEATATGDGPIDAAYFAVGKIVNVACRIDDYTIRSVSEGQEALGEVMVKLAFGGEVYTGSDISTDIIEASITAYINGINKIVEATAAA